jgi:hypothetical protein
MPARMQLAVVRSDILRLQRTLAKNKANTGWMPSFGTLDYPQLFNSKDREGLDCRWW